MKYREMLVNYLYRYLIFVYVFIMIFFSLWQFIMSITDT